MLGELTAIDVAEEMLARARRNTVNWPCFCRRTLSLLPQVVETVWMRSFVIPYFRILEQPQAVLSEFARVLRAGGRLVVAHGESRAAINALHDKMVLQ